ncbi:MAG: hypothetical protein KC619_25945 [Myxococcales bacterium]|nr:hypothetical protein [Myxococcales bacterium]
MFLAALNGGEVVWSIVRPSRPKSTPSRPGLVLPGDAFRGEWGWMLVIAARLAVTVLGIWIGWGTCLQGATWRLIVILVPLITPLGLLLVVLVVMRVVVPLLDIPTRKHPPPSRFIPVVGRVWMAAALVSSVLAVVSFDASASRPLDSEIGVAALATAAWFIVIQAARMGASDQHERLRQLHTQAIRGVIDRRQLLEELEVIENGHIAADALGASYTKCMDSMRGLVSAIDEARSLAEAVLTKLAPMPDQALKGRQDVVVATLLAQLASVVESLPRVTKKCSRNVVAFTARLRVVISLTEARDGSLVHLLDSVEERVKLREEKTDHLADLLSRLGAEKKRVGLES